MILFLLLISRQGKLRLAKWYQSDLTSKEKLIIIRDVCNISISRSARLSNFIPYNLPSSSIAYQEALSKYNNNNNNYFNNNNNNKYKPFSSHTDRYYFTLVCKRYASLNFIACVEASIIITNPISSEYYLNNNNNLDNNNNNNSNNNNNN
eukprot:Tbor_TRINITY_DN5813_c5_g1::TRINITY_DN5813_c5_g1_i2::g.6297::m.6297